MERTKCAKSSRAPSKRAYEVKLTDLVMPKDKTLSDIVSGLQCSYSSFMIAKTMNIHLPKYPCVFLIDEDNNVRKNPDAWITLRNILSDARNHGVFSITIAKYFGELNIMQIDISKFYIHHFTNHLIN